MSHGVVNVLALFLRPKIAGSLAIGFCLSSGCF